MERRSLLGEVVDNDDHWAVDQIDDIRSRIGNPTKLDFPQFWTGRG